VNQGIFFRNHPVIQRCISPEILTMTGKYVYLLGGCLIIRPNYSSFLNKHSSQINYTFIVSFEKNQVIHVCLAFGFLNRYFFFLLFFVTLLSNEVLHERLE
jgi:hypothetical protein